MILLFFKNRNALLLNYVIQYRIFQSCLWHELFLSCGKYNWLSSSVSNWCVTEKLNHKFRYKITSYIIVLRLKVKLLASVVDYKAHSIGLHFVCSSSSLQYRYCFPGDQ